MNSAKAQRPYVPGWFTPRYPEASDIGSHQERQGHESAPLLRHGVRISQHASACLSMGPAVPDFPGLFAILSRRLNEAQICLELVRLADLDPPEIPVERIQQVIELGRDDGARYGKNGGR